MDVTVLQERARLLQAVRAFFDQRKVLEVETPALSSSGNTDPSIQSFQVADSEGLRYLHTSPEYAMKRLLVAGAGDIYQICKVWRAGELGRYHQPEFTMLEWYRLGFDYHALMREVEALMLLLLPTLAASRFVSYRQLFLEVLDIDPHSARDVVLSACMAQQQLDVVGELSRSEKLDVLMTHCIEPGFAVDRLTFVFDYPAEQKALACLSDEDIPVAQRFEVYLGQVELGNGYQEQTDAALNAEVLYTDQRIRQQRQLPEVPPDERFLQAMQQGLPRCAGVAVGLDRLLMCVLGKKKLQEVISFSWTVA